MAKRYTTTTKALVIISFSADDDKQAEETFQRIVKDLRENVISYELDDARVVVESENWHTSFSI